MISVSQFQILSQRILVQSSVTAFVAATFATARTTAGSLQLRLQIHEVHTVFGTRGSHLRTNTAGSTEVDTDGSDLGRLTVVLLLRTFGSSRKAEYTEVVDVYRTAIESSRRIAPTKLVITLCISPRVSELILSSEQQYFPVSPIFPKRLIEGSIYPYHLYGKGLYVILS